jgi:kinesin family protein 5
MEAVTVVARFRGAENGMDDMGEWVLTDTSIKHNEKHHEFNFDAVLNPSRSQAELYEAAGRKMMNFFCEGFNGTIFAYGQSGSGKTFSMLGPEEVTEILINSKDNIPEETAEMFGITPRATFHVFENIRAGQEKGTVYNLKVSYVEVYNEMINDILSSPPGLNLKMREFPNAGMCVIGLREDVANTPEAVFQALSNGTANRVVCSTGQNARSSRSHTVFILSLEQKTAEGTVKNAKINLVDLAGSEKLSKTGAQGQSLTEAKNINLSLTTLGRCIKALTSGTNEFVPYRESKLTLILKESLSGAAMTTLIVTGSMRKIHQEETIGTMQFAERAKMVKTKAKSNTKRSYDELEKLFNKLSEEVKVLKAALGGAPISLPSEPSSDTPASSEAPQPQPLISEADLKAVEELKSSYEALKSRSLKEIEELSARLKKAEASQNNIDYLEVHEEMESFHDQLAKDNKLISELSSEKEKEMQDFERKLADISMKTENVSIEIAQAVQELSNNHKEYEELAEQLKVKDSEIFKLSQEAEHLRIKKKGFEKELEILEAKIKDQGAHYPEMYKEIEKIRHQIQESIQKKQEIEENIDKNEAESQEIIGKSLLLQKKEAQHSQELESLSATKENIEKQLTILKTSKKQKKNELLSLKESQKSLLEAQEKSNHVHHHELQQLKHKLASEQKGTDLEAFNELKLKLAEEQAQPLQVEISKLKQEKSQVLFETQQLASDLESLKDQIQKFSQNNSHLKEDLRKNTVSLSRLQKEISDEKTSRARIAKNIKAFEETLAKAIKEALAQAKTEEQIRITDYVQEINVLQNEIDKKERYIEETKKNHQKDMKKFRNDLEEAKELKEFEEKLEIEKKTVLKNLNTKNDEIFRIKEIISANEAKIHLGITQIEKLEADVRHKAAERDIERKKTMRQTIVPRKMSVFQAQIPNPDEKKSFHGVQLKKTNNKFLIDAIQESNKNAQFHELYKVAYEFQAIKSLYANIDEPQVDDSMFVPVEEEEKSSSDSDELS